jgi:MoxR-like ATPase
MQINVGYPDESSERRMVIATTGADLPTLSPVMSSSDLLRTHAVVRQMPVAERLLDAILAIVRSARPVDGADQRVRSLVGWGPGPRASQALSLAARALALIDGRKAPSIDDIRRLVKPVLRHRMALNFTARAQSIDVDGFIDEIVAKAL